MFSGSLPLKFFVPPAAGGYAAPGVSSDGTAWLEIASLASTDNSFFSSVGWLKIAVDQYNPGGNTVFASDPAGISSVSMGPGPFDTTINLRAGDGTNYQQDNSNNGQPTDEWYCIIQSIDSSGVYKVYVNDTDVTAVSASFGVPFSPIRTNGLKFTFANDTFGDFVIGGFADWRIMPGTSLLSAGDIPLLTRRLFIDSNGKPVDPAVATASLGVPCILFSGDASSFGTNQGSGGAFTQHGAFSNIPGPSA